jgi:hypothetical protein
VPQQSGAGIFFRLMDLLLPVGFLPVGFLPVGFLPVGFSPVAYRFDSPPHSP